VTDRDNITLPREVVQEALEALEFAEKNHGGITALRTALAAEKRHPGYVIGNHWFETAYERLCAGEAEDAILEDYELVREPRLRDLRRDAERYRWLRERKAPPDIGDMASVRDSHDPSEIDAAIDAEMEASTAPASAAADSSTAPEDKP